MTDAAWIHHAREKEGKAMTAEDVRLANERLAGFFDLVTRIAQRLGEEETR